MSENLGNFLVDLACNPQLMAQFVGDPARVLAETALTDEERTIVMTRNPRLLASALGTTGYALGQGINNAPPGPKKRAPARKKKMPKVPPKKTPARPPRKKR